MSTGQAPVASSSESDQNNQPDNNERHQIQTQALIISSEKMKKGLKQAASAGDLN